MVSVLDPTPRAATGEITMALKDKAITIVVFMIFLNAAPGVMMASGVAEDMGIDPSVSGGDNINAANDDMEDVRVSGGLAQTLFTLYTSVTGPVGTLLGVLIGAELMFMSLGVPEWLVTFLFAPKWIIFGGTLIYVLAGRRL